MKYAELKFVIDQSGNIGELISVINQLKASIFLLK